jgi:hypothetical protein
MLFYLFLKYLFKESEFFIMNNLKDSQKCLYLKFIIEEGPKSVEIA